MGPWKCKKCARWNDLHKLSCIECNSMDQSIELFFHGDVMYDFIKYLDGITLVNLYFSNILQSLSSNSTNAVNYWTLSRFIEQNRFTDDEEQNKSNNNFCDTIDVLPSNSELYFSGDMHSLKKKVSYHCDIELEYRDSTNWNETWNETLKLPNYWEYSTRYCGYTREQDAKFIQFHQCIPTQSDNKQHSNKDWMECVNMDDLLKYLFDPGVKTALQTLDVFILDYTCLRTMDRPFKFVTMDNVTMCFLKNNNFGDNMFVARQWQQYEA